MHGNDDEQENQIVSSALMLLLIVFFLLLLFRWDYDYFINKDNFLLWNKLEKVTFEEHAVFASVIIYVKNYCGSNLKFEFIFKVKYSCQSRNLVKLPSKSNTNVRHNINYERIKLKISKISIICLITPPTQKMYSTFRMQLLQWCLDPDQNLLTDI